MIIHHRWFGRLTLPTTMKNLSWNCMGLRNPRAVRALLRLIRIENFDLVFLMETRLKKDKAQAIKFKISFECYHNVGCSGNERERVGGLILLWKEKIQISILSFSNNHIGGLCLMSVTIWIGTSIVYMVIRRNNTRGRHHC